MATYYVSTEGSDSNDGTSIGTAKATVAAGVALLVAGDTLEILPGVYEIGSTIVVSVPNVTIRGYQGVMPTLRGLAGAAFGPMFDFVTAAAGGTVADLEVDGNWTNSGASTLFAVRATAQRSTFSILRCTLYDTNSYIVHCSNNVWLRMMHCYIGRVRTGVAAYAVGNDGGATIVGNVYVPHPNNTAFIDCSASTYRASDISHNIILRGSPYGIHAGTKATVRHNVIWGAARGIQLQGTTSPNDVVIENNIIGNCSAYGIIPQSWAGDPMQSPTIRNNAFYNNTSGNYGGNILPGDGDVLLTEDPFVDSANGDYSLTPSATELLLGGTPRSWPGLATPDSSRSIGAWQPSGGGGINWSLIRRIAALGDLRFSPSGATY